MRAVVAGRLFPRDDIAAHGGPAGCRDITFRVEPMGPLAELERDWRRLEADAAPSFFLSWNWIGTLLETIPPEVAPRLLRGTVGDRTVALGVLGDASIRRHRVVRARRWVLNATGDPEFDCVHLEHNGLLAAPQAGWAGLLDAFANTAGVAMVESQRSQLLAENRELRDRLRSGGPETGRVVSQSREIASILQLLRKVADTPANILFVGETGTGKGLFAQVLHDISARREGPFVQVNCAAIPENLLESELFGHEKGAFTGAVARRIGKFEEANNGTLLLDEISEMDLRLQAKLLRVLQEREIDRIGGTKPIKVNIRVLATSNRNMQEEIKKVKLNAPARRSAE